MSSTFMGLEIARRGLTAQQSALSVTGQNISNANTPGYSRQKVNFTQTEPYPSMGMDREQIPGQMGTGVSADSIQRVRDGFLDVQYRTENNKVGYWQARSDALSKLEGVMNEPSDSGLANTMDQFWQSLQDLQTDPTNSGALSVVSQRGQALTDTFNYLSNSITSDQGDAKNQIDVTVKQANSILEQLNQVNQQIGRVEPNGYLPNDLYDARDRLIDQLSSIVNISVGYVKPSGNANPKAEGQAVIKLVDDNGNEMGNLLSAAGNSELKMDYTGADNSVKSITIGAPGETDTSNDKVLTFSQISSSGSLKGLIEAYGYDDNGKATGIYPDMLNQLDTLAYTFATNFNAQQKQGYSANDINNYQKDPTTQPAKDAFFADQSGTDISSTTTSKGFAAIIQMSNTIKQSASNIATAGGTSLANATLGDSTNVQALSNIINQKYNYNSIEQDDFRSYYQNVIGAMGVQSQEATTLNQNSTTLQQSVDSKRQSVSSVSLDEEMTNMIQYQQAYNASARMISIQDAILDKLINGMGAGK